jgi:hypothetical protein
MAIKCAANDCLHNKSHKCTASVIQVEHCRAYGNRSNHCATHTNDQGNYLLTAMERPSHPARAGEIFGIEAAEEFKVASYPQSTAVLCGVVNCRYNNQKSCSAEDVNIGRSFRKNTPRFPCKTCKID